MTNRLSRVGDRFRTKFSLVDGREFYGQLLDIPDTSRVSNFLSARRYLRTNVDTIVQPGLVMKTEGTRFIIGEHGTGYYTEPIYKHFKLFDVDMELQWYPIEEEEDSVTGVITRTPSQTSAGLVYVSSQPLPHKIDASIMVPQSTKAAVVDKPVGLGDRIGNMIVTKVDQVLGVYFVELKVE